MAVVAVLAGSVLGFLATVIATITLELSWFAALGLWWGLGSLIAILLLVALLAPKSAGTTSLANDRA